MVVNAIAPTLYNIVRVGSIVVAAAGSFVVVRPLFRKRQNEGWEVKLIIWGACLMALSMLEVVASDFVWKATHPAG